MYISSFESLSLKCISSAATGRILQYPSFLPSFRSYFEPCGRADELLKTGVTCAAGRPRESLLHSLTETRGECKCSALARPSNLISQIRPAAASRVPSRDRQGPRGNVSNRVCAYRVSSSSPCLANANRPHIDTNDTLPSMSSLAAFGKTIYGAYLSQPGSVPRINLSAGEAQERDVTAGRLIHPGDFIMSSPRV